MTGARIIIGSDLCPTAANESYFREGRIEELFGDLLPLFQGAELSIINLECPAVERPSPQLKSGPNLSCHPDCLKSLAEAGIDLVGLANNHVMDHGEAGLECTLRTCDKFGLAAIGAGPNLAAARRHFVGDVGGIRIGVVAAAEREWIAAGEATAGVNPLDAVEFVRFVKRERASFDKLIVLLHGGNEHNPYPSPRMVDTCRFLVEEGADLVAVQHTHCPGCFEYYRGGTILYGQGNLIFDYPSRHSAWHQGFLIDVEVRSDGTLVPRWRPYVQSRGQAGLRRMPPDEERQFLTQLEKRSAEIEDPKFVAQRWNDFCRDREAAYLSALFGHNRFWYGLNKYSGFVKRLSSKRKLAATCNIVRCESHREALVTIFENLLSKHRDPPRSK
ncbi:MAG: CapA family protein [Pirellulales bacterium]|nr:CapA family protein [Pirellulales bacterium]